MLNPGGLWVKLLELLLSRRNCADLAVEKNCARTRCSLIEREYVLLTHSGFSHEMSFRRRAIISPAVPFQKRVPDQRSSSVVFWGSGLSFLTFVRYINSICRIIATSNVS